VSRYNSAKRSGKIPGNMLRYGSGSNSGNMLGYDSGKVLGSNSGKELGTISNKSPGKRSGKNSSKEAGRDKTCKTRRFLCFGINPS
jgi:hypothetical protein